MIPVKRAVEEEERAVGRAVVDLWPVITTFITNSFTKEVILCGSRPGSEKAKASEN
jgi:hypothetical protein